MHIFLALILLILPTAQADEMLWSRVLLPAGNLHLVGFAPSDMRYATTLNIYIEGDGQPGTALDLAKSTPGHNVYLGRPCQFQFKPAMASCSKAVWTTHRYSPDVVKEFERAIDALKIRYRADHVRLIGFSGGGAIATLLATRRSDVSFLVTVAGNLDTEFWSELNGGVPLDGSMNPSHYASVLRHIPQFHLIGDNDRTVPSAVLNAYLSHLSSLDKVQSKITMTDHTCCWQGDLKVVMQSIEAGFRR